MHYATFFLFTVFGSAIAHPYNELSARAEAAWTKAHAITAPRCELTPGQVAGTIGGGCAGGYFFEGVNRDCGCSQSGSGLYYCIDTAVIPLKGCKTDSDCPEGGICDISMGSPHDVEGNEIIPGGGQCGYSKTCTSTYGSKLIPTTHTINAPKCKLGPNEVIGTPFSGGCTGSITKDGVVHDCVCDMAASGVSYCLNEAILPMDKNCKVDSDCPQGAACDVNLGNYCVKATGCFSHYVGE